MNSDRFVIMSHCTTHDYGMTESECSKLTHQRQLKDIEKARKIGIESYNEEQAQKIEILHILLSNYNCGYLYALSINLRIFPPSIFFLSSTEIFE